MRIVFMGTPEFAVTILDAIVQKGYEIAAVVTTPDKPAGRGLKLRPSAIKEYAVAHQLLVLQPEKLKDESFIQQLRNLQADVFVVVAFRMLPEVVFTIPPKGTFNVHASILPNYRGAAPIHHAVMNGEVETGVTTFFLDKNMDTGDIIDTIRVPISPTATTGEMYQKLMEQGAILTIRTLEKINNGTVRTQPQPFIPFDQLKLAPKIFKEDTYINWESPAQNIFNKIRGLSPSPCACTRIRKIQGDIEQIKIFEAEIVHKPSRSAGTMEIMDSDKLVISTKTEKILIKSLQIQGKTRLKCADFLRGFHSEHYILKVF